MTDKYLSIWFAVLGILVALLFAGIFMILQTLTRVMPIGVVVAWTMTILAFFGIVAILIYVLIIDRIKAIALEVKKLEENSAKTNEVKQIVKEVNDATNTFRDAYKVATKELLVAAQELGLDMVYKTRAQVEIELEGFITHAKREVKFLGISISMPTRLPRYRELIAQKVKEGVSFQFAFLQRDSGDGIFDFYRQRSFDENYPISPTKIGDLKQETTSNIGALQAIRSGLSETEREKVEVAEYAAFPYMSMVIIDDEMFVGPYLFGENCPNTPMYRIVKTDEGIYNTYYKHFIKLWNSASRVLQ